MLAGYQQAVKRTFNVGRGEEAVRSDILRINIAGTLGECNIYNDKIDEIN